MADNNELQPEKIHKSMPPRFDKRNERTNPEDEKTNKIDEDKVDEDEFEDNFEDDEETNDKILRSTDITEEEKEHLKLLANDIKLMYSGEMDEWTSSEDRDFGAQMGTIYFKDETHIVKKNGEPISPQEWVPYVIRQHTRLSHYCKLRIGGRNALLISYDPARNCGYVTFKTRQRVAMRTATSLFVPKRANKSNDDEQETYNVRDF